MALSMRDCKVGTIVDHTFERREEDGKEVARETIRRGIITEVRGSLSQGSISKVFVTFKLDAEPEDVKACELVRVFPAGHRVAREAYRRISGQPRHVGAEFTQRRGVTMRKIQDSLALTPSRKDAPITPELDDALDQAGMGLEDKQA